MNIPTETQIAEIIEAIKRLRSTGEALPHQAQELFTLQLKLVRLKSDILPAETQRAFSQLMWEELNRILWIFGEVADKLQIKVEPETFLRSRASTQVFGRCRN